MKNCIPNYSVNIPYQFHPHLLSDRVTKDYDDDDDNDGDNDDDNSNDD